MQLKVTNLKLNPARLREHILNMAFAGQSVHIGCAFSIVELVATVYRSFLNLGDGTPNSKDRDYFVLSKGHGVMALYACFYELGWLEENDLINYFQDGTRLKGLSESDIPGLEVSSGSLGHGLSVGVGLALAAKRNKEGRNVFCLVGDGEMNEGSIWEGLMFASQFKLGNFVLLVDANSFQAMGRTKEILDLIDIEQKLKSFGFEASSVDGHDEVEIAQKLTHLLKTNKDKPKALIAKTIKGYGVSFMHDNNAWHYSRLTPELHKAALSELKKGP
jgi:transketolase